MKKILPFLTCILLFSCIEQIDFDIDEQAELVVVDGVFAAGAEQNVIKLSKSIELNSQINEPLGDASVYVEDNQGGQIGFTESQEGVYISEEGPQAGLQYRLFAELPDGTLISSNYQSVPESFAISEIVTVDSLITFLNESGSTQRQNSVEFYAVAKNESIDNDLFLRFSYETAYQVLESKCGPFHNPKACYFYNDERPFDINLFEIDKDASAVEFSSLVLRRKINYELSELFGLDLRLLSYNKEEFEYWKNLKSLFDQSGNINDVNPARLVGNISSNNGTEVLGQFAVVSQSRKVKLIGNADFSTYTLPFCGVAGNRPWPLPEECCQCLNLSGATANKPSFWP